MKFTELQSINPSDLINIIKTKIANITTIILGVIIASNIYQNQNKMIDALKAEKEKQVEKNEVLNSIRTSERKINLYKSLFTRRDASATINTINNIAKVAGIQIISIRPAAEEMLASYIKYPFTLSIRADGYHNMGKFISELENHSDIYFIDSIELRNESELPETTRTGQQYQEYYLAVDMIVSTFILKD